ncbi:recombinase family protein [Aliiroseovarius sp. S2029]|uniref:recombinase family protein n=1 Tax=Aliiroseovarius sp. S2029 TaxID=2936988 RepID=UPI0020BF70DF|nr:recombinase family protein [Aliiroseovarius sp. S2029]MCK8484327.1 recombinase family protein [Aliiroseovarius sp. S2029]
MTAHLETLRQTVEARGGALVGYARVSSAGQSLEVQTAALEYAGVAQRHLYAEKASGTKREGRDQLAHMLRSLRRGDCLVITRLDRLARSTSDLLSIAKQVDEAGADFVALEQTINTTTPEGRLFFTMVAAFGEFETEVRKARQMEGIAAAKAKGEDSPFKGRPASIDAKKVMQLREEGVGPAEIARRLGISRQSVYRLTRQTSTA